MEPSKKRKDVDEDKESSRLERDDDEQEIDQGSHSELLSPSKIKKCSAETSLSTSADHSSAPPSQQPPGGNHGAQERDQRHSDQSVQPETMQAPRYYTRSAARKLPPPPPSQLRAGKLLIQNVDRGSRHTQLYKNMLMRETATSRVTPLVPDAKPNASGIVPLGPPPPREPRLPLSPCISAQQREMKLHDQGWLRSRMIAKFPESSDSGAAESCQNSQPAEAGRSHHLAPPSMSYGDAWEIVASFNERIKNQQAVDSDRREQFLALQRALGFPESAGLFELYQISGSMEEVTNYLMDYFESWETRESNVPEESQAEGQVSSEKDLGQCLQPVLFPNHIGDELSHRCPVIVSVR